MGINANYAFIRGKHNDEVFKSLLKKIRRNSIALSGEYTLPQRTSCETVHEFGPLKMSSISFAIKDVWKVADDLFAVAFENYPALLYFTLEHGFDNSYNTKIKINIIDYDIIENIINNTSYKTVHEKSRETKHNLQLKADALTKYLTDLNKNIPH